MRLEYGIRLDDVVVPRFSVEAVEGISKLFTLATLILNVLDTKKRVEIVFHGVSPEDPERKIRAFREIIESSPEQKGISFSVSKGGQVRGSSSYFCWLTAERT